MGGSLNKTLGWVLGLDLKIRNRVSAYTSPVRRSFWLWRFELRKLVQRFSVSKDELLTSSQVEIHFINLDHRVDRLKQVSKELSKLNLGSPKRFSAIYEVSGAVGCAKSHGYLTQSLGGSSSPALICEDDAEFLVSKKRLKEVIDEFLADRVLDVLCIANSTSGQPHRISERLAITNNTQTTSCYLVKPSALKLLSKSFLKSSRMLEAGFPANRYAADMLWKRLQNGRLIFAVPTVRLARQTSSYSDIQRRFTDYR